MGLLIRAKRVKSLTIGIVKPQSGESFTLNELQSFVDGLIEPVRIPSFKVGEEIRSGKTVYKITDKTVMLANEEGLINGLPINLVATSLVGQPIFGDVVLVEGGTEFI